MDFLGKLEEIREERPTYRTGGSGKDGTCDCVGLLMGAMDRAGFRKEWPLHSSNWFCRFQLEELGPVERYEVGMAVLKAREPGAAGYDLNERYQEGGRYYTGDLRDYYHIGVVISEAPLIILHCTSSGGVSGIVTDMEPGRWAYGGRIKGIDYTETGGGEPVEMVVFAENGKPVRMRKAPSTGAELLTKVPVWERVSMTAEAGEWATVEWNGMRGYMMRKLLTEVPGAAEPVGPGEETDDVGGLTAEQGEVIIGLLREILEKMEGVC